ncbi:hypothetical protein N3K66_004910 [Trichothecium roseum]|uniref:Uncharacterized protein n=1 Tax=Trichothecium roseum TaxID=47278 RepID=A0ACC0V4L2_9HYPO|nr:hypothetical protein N3K66_004910 [Trichothecium roseum]
MDLAYDHITEDSYKEGDKSKDETKDDSKPEQTQASLSADVQDAYKAFSNSPWGAKLGGFFGTVKKQGEGLYTQASKEFSEVGEDAQKGFSALLTHTRGISLNTALQETSYDARKAAANDDEQTTPTNSKAPATEEGESSESMFNRLKLEAAKRLKDLQKAEDAADEALLRFGGNVRNFLRDAISISPPEAGENNSTLLFESKDAQGKRVIHTSRFDAQLHVIHTTTDSFTKDSPGPEFKQWSNDFDIDKKTDSISADLEKYPDLRATMEKLVPDEIPYADFWKRYYFLRHGIETAEARRRDLLKAAEAEDEDEGWGDDSDDESAAPTSNAAGKKPASSASSVTLNPSTQKNAKPTATRTSNDEKSQDSEASYDVVGAASGKTSQAPNSPKEAPKTAPKVAPKAAPKGAPKDTKNAAKKPSESSDDDSDDSDDSSEESSDDDDWE